MKPISRGWHLFFVIGFFVLLAALAATLYSNYNYIVFKILIADNYIFTDTLDEWYKESLGDQPYTYGSRFDHAVVASVTEKIRSINNDRYTYLYTPPAYELSREIEKSDAAEARLEELSEKTAYISLPNISTGTKDFFMDSKKTLSNYENLVLDLRENYGGLLMDCYAIADELLPGGSIVGHEKTRLPFLTHAIKAGGKPSLEFRKIVVLQDKNTASAAESLIQALKDNMQNVVTMGEKTFGKGIGQVTIPMTGGYAVKATVLLVTGPQDKSIHGIGISPDIEAPGENILELALAEAEK
ncbi:MAG: S41 family peptidase [Clostridiales bacterium]|jgi:C-terminal peptidase prc|nr:S41 family peptidase [Clostridiales bacterium]